MANSEDPDQLASPTDLDLHCLQRQAISRFSRTSIKTMTVIDQLAIQKVWLTVVNHGDFWPLIYFLLQSAISNDYVSSRVQI